MHGVQIGVRTALVRGTAKSHEPLPPCELLGGVNCWTEGGGWRGDARAAMCWAAMRSPSTGVGAG